VTKLRPLCRFCGNPIAKTTVTVQFVENGSNTNSPSGNWRQRVGAPRTREEAQRFVNEPIQTVKFLGDGDDKRIVKLTAWDGESYLDEHFCKDSCAQFFGRMIAKAKPDWASETYWKKLAEQKARS
jgi:hypothetical protein